MPASPSSPSLSAILDSVRNNTVNSRISWDVWWAQEGEDEREKHLDAMNRFSEFFRFDAAAHLTATVTGAYRLYDKRSDVRSLSMLIASSKSSPDINSQVVSKAQSLYDSVSPTVEKLSTLRNKAFGHTDLRRSYAAVFDAADITPLELRYLIDTALEIVNLYESALGEPKTEFDDYPVEHLRQLLQAIHEQEG